MDYLLENVEHLNFNIEVENNKIDKKISPIIYSCYLGKQEYVEICLMNPCLEIDL
jgi:hypothetical protein